MLLLYVLWQLIDVAFGVIENAEYLGFIEDGVFMTAWGFVL